MDNSPPREFPSHPLPRTDVNRNNNNNNGAHDSGQDHPRVRFAEGGPQTIFQPTPRRDRPPTTTTDSTGQPAVYWDDRDNDPNTSGYTFYREGTPTPPEYGSHEKGLGHGRGLAGPAGEGSTAGAGAFGSEADINQWNLPPGTQSNRPLWGMERKRLIAIVILVLICVAIGLGVGLGVGLSRGKTTGVESVPVPARFVISEPPVVSEDILTPLQYLVTSLGCEPSADNDRSAHRNSSWHQRCVGDDDGLGCQPTADVQLGLPVPE